MNEVRMNSLKRVLDNSLKCITKYAGFCRNRAYEEFDIKSLYVSAAVAIARGFNKWKNSTGVISECINSLSNFKTTKSSWIKNSVKWQKGMKINMNLPLNELKNAIIANRSQRAHEKDKSLIGEWANKFGIKSGINLRRAEIQQAKLEGNINNLLKKRLGTFYYTNHLVRLGHLDDSFKYKCISCNQNIKEDAENSILYCSAYNNVRQNIWPGLIGKLERANEIQKICVFKLLLREEEPSSGRKSVSGVCKLTKYLGCILLKRAAVMAERGGVNL